MTAGYQTRNQEQFYNETGLTCREFDILQNVSKRYTYKSLVKGYCLLGHDKNGQKNHPLYTTWKGMVQRCYYPKHSQFHYYGGKGVRVCFRWLNSFANFAEDMGMRPMGTTIDRIDSRGWYCPDNCKWSTAKEQNANKGIRKNNKYLQGTYPRDGKWRAKIGLDYKQIILGTFNTEIEAHTEYLKKFKEIHGYIPEAINQLGVSI